jgi:pantoate--beta-alanine ligase
MSSRKRFLTVSQRAQAPALHAALCAARHAIAGAVAVDDALAAARKLLPAASFSIDYLALVQGETLRPTDRAETGARLISAVRLGSVRLLDNIAAHTG